MDKDENKDYYNLTKEQEEQIIGDNKIKKEVYNYFVLASMEKLKLSKSEYTMCNDILFTVYLNTLEEQPAGLWYEEINSTKILDECTTELHIDKDKFIKIITYLFIYNKLLISPVITRENTGKLPRVKNLNGGNVVHCLPDQRYCEDFIKGMPDVINKVNNRIIYLRNDALINKSKIIAKKMKHVSINIKQMKEETKKITQDAKNEIDGLKGQIITIVGLLVSIVPLMTTNLSLVNNNASCSNILLSNGILILVIGLIFSMINQLVCKKFKSRLLWIVGIILIIIAIVTQDLYLIKEFITSLNSLLKILLENKFKIQIIF